MKKSLPLVVALVAAVLVAALALTLRHRADPNPVAPPLPGSEIAHAAGAQDGTALDAVNPADPSGAAATVERAKVAAPGRDRANAIVDDLELRDGHWVEGRLELAEGTPLDEVAYVVAAGREFERRPLHRALVGPDGRFRVAFAKDTKLGWLRLDARYNYLEEPPPVRVDKPVAEMVLKSKLGGCIRGRLLVAADAQSQADAVRAGRATAGGNEFDWFGLQHKEGHILDDLTYEVGGLEPGTGRHVSIQAKGFIDGASGPLDVQAASVTTHDIAMNLGAIVAGRVLGPDKAPIVGAVLRPHYGEGGSRRFFTSMQDTVKSDEAGAFTMRGLDEGDFTLVVQKPGFAPVFHTVGHIVPSTRKNDVEVEMGNGLVIAGKVQLENGKLPTRATIDVRDADGDKGPAGFEGARWLLMDREPVEAAPDGSFRVQGLLPGRYLVTALGWEGADAAAEAAEARARAEAEAAGKPRRIVKRGGAWSARLENVTSGTEGLLVTLTRGDRLRGRAVDGAGQPVERFTVHAEPDRSSPNYTSDIDGFEKVFRDKDGRFVLEGLRPCGWNIHVTARGYMPSSAQPITVPGAKDDGTFTLLKLAKMSGIVLDPERRPVSGAKVVASSDPQNWQLGIGGATTRTNEKGEFALVGVPLGAVKVRAEAMGWVRSEALRLETAAASTHPNVELVLTRGATLRGDVTDSDGKKAAGRSVKVTGISDDFDKTTRTDPEGAFVVEALPPGRYRVSADVGDARMFQGFADSSMDLFDPTLRRVVTVKDGETASVSLGRARPPRIRLHGHVKGSAAGAMLTARHVRDADAGSAGIGVSRTAEITDGGAYEVALSSSGPWHVSIGGGSTGAVCEFQVDVPEGPEFEQDFTLPNGVIRGRVVTSDGDPVAKMNVRLLSSRPTSALGRDANQSHTADDGTFSFEALPDGTYTLRTDDYEDWWDRDVKRPRGHAHRDGVVVKDAGTVEDVQLVLAPDGALSGTVRGASGDLMPNAMVFVYDASGHAISRNNGPVESDGAGRFRFDKLPEGRVFLSARTPHGAGKASGLVRVDGHEEVEIRLRPGCDLVATTQDASGAPTFATITVVDEDGRHFEETDTFSEDMIDVPPGSQAFTALPAGRYTITAIGANGWTVRKDVRLVEGGRNDVLLRASP